MQLAGNSLPCVITHAPQLEAGSLAHAEDALCEILDRSSSFRQLSGDAWLNEIRSKSDRESHDGAAGQHGLRNHHRACILDRWTDEEIRGRVALRQSSLAMHLTEVQPLDPRNVMWPESTVTERGHRQLHPTISKAGRQFPERFEQQRHPLIGDIESNAANKHHRRLR
jgi:hypothetical protein